MATNLRVGQAHGYQPYLEIEAVSPYPRINPQQPRDEYPQQQGSQRANKEDTARRRFRAMRQLIDQLKATAPITRVDYFTAEAELKNTGLTILENNLIELLLELKFPPAGIDTLLPRLRENAAHQNIEAGHGLREEANFLPVYVPGLDEYLLTFEPVALAFAACSGQVRAALATDGYCSGERERLRIALKPLSGEGGQRDRLQLSCAVVVAIGEADEEGRKVLLYRRADRDYALYADKQINLSI